jgi:hypothetical protein
MSDPKTQQRKTPWFTIAIVLGLFLLIALNISSLHRATSRTIVVRNAGKMPIRVLAMGTMEDRILPLWSKSSPEFQDAINPGAQTTFQYRVDDVNLCWLLVHVDNESFRVLKTRLGEEVCALPPATKTWPCCLPVAEGTVLVVPPTAELELAPEALVSLTSER